MNVTNLRRITTRPQKKGGIPGTRWLLEVGGIDVSLKTKELLNWTTCRKRIKEQTAIVIPSGRFDQWDDIVRELLADIAERDNQPSRPILGFDLLILENQIQSRNLEARDACMESLAETALVLDSARFGRSVDSKQAQNCLERGRHGF